MVAMVLLDASASVSLYQNVVCGSIVGMLYRDDDKKSSILTTRDLIDVSANAPMRPVIPQELAERIFQAVSTGGPKNPEMPAWARVWDDRDVFIAEMAVSLGKSPRAVAAALRKKEPRVIEPDCPWILAGYEYLGAFAVTRGLIIADRCYVDQEHILLARKTPALAGKWHAYRRHDPMFTGRTVALLVVHEDHFERAKDHGEPLGHFGVDAGCAIIVDQRVLDDPKLVHELKESAAWDEGMIQDESDNVGIYSYTYDGDGLYSVRAMKQGDQVVAVRANVTRNPEFDYHSPPPSEKYTKALEKSLSGAGPAKPYATTATFVVGEQVAHKKFGTGLVQRVVDAGKVEIAFPDGVKVLVHGQKK